MYRSQVSSCRDPHNASFQICFYFSFTVLPQGILGLYLHKLMTFIDETDIKSDSLTLTFTENQIPVFRSIFSEFKGHYFSHVIQKVLLPFQVFISFSIEQETQTAPALQACIVRNRQNNIECLGCLDCSVNESCYIANCNFQCCYQRTTELQVQLESSNSLLFAINSGFSSFNSRKLLKYHFQHSSICM